MRISYIAISVINVVKLVQPSTLNSIAVGVFNKLTTTLNHSEVLRVSIVKWIGWTFVKSSHLLQTWNFLEIHTFPLNDKLIIFSVSIISKLYAVRAVTNFTWSKLVYILISHGEVNRIHRHCMLILRLFFSTSECLCLEFRFLFRLVWVSNYFHRRRHSTIHNIFIVGYFQNWWSRTQIVF